MQGPVPQKKQKIEKRDLPEWNVHFCEICDRGFKTEEKFKEHTDEHTKVRPPAINNAHTLQQSVNMSSINI